MARVNFDDQDAISNRKPRLFFKEGTVTRFCLLENDAEYDRYHYDHGYVACTKNGSTPDEKHRCFWCENGHQDKPRFAVHVVKYLTRPDGLPAGDPSAPGFFTVMPWFFGRDKWDHIAGFRKTWGDLRGHDFLFQCQVENFQKGMLQIAPEAWWRKDEKTEKLVLGLLRANQSDNLIDDMRTYVPYAEQAAHSAQAEKAAQNRELQKQQGGRGGFGQQPQSGGFHSPQQPGFGQGFSNFSSPMPAFSGGFAPPQFQAVEVPIAHQREAFMPDIAPKGHGSRNLDEIMAEMERG